MVAPFHFVILLAVVFAVALPIVFVVRAKNRRQVAIQRGDIVLQEKTNTLSIVALITVLFCAILGIVFGHISLSQIKRTNERGWGLAAAALWMGYATAGSTVLCLIIGAIAAATSHTAS